MHLSKTRCRTFWSWFNEARVTSSITAFDNLLVIGRLNLRYKLALNFAGPGIFFEPSSRHDSRSPNSVGISFPIRERDTTKDVTLENVSGSNNSEEKVLSILIRNVCFPSDQIKSQVKRFYAVRARRILFRFRYDDDHGSQLPFERETGQMRQSLNKTNKTSFRRSATSYREA